MNYKIEGGDLPVAILYLESGENVITESGAMSWMSPNMKMETVSGGGVGKMIGRMFSGETLFLNKYTAIGGEGLIAFAGSLPGSIRAFEITPDNPIIAQKSSFLVASNGVELSVHFQKKLGSGFFGGEGFIMQKISGNGTAFLEFDGAVVEYELEAGQKLILDTGHLAAMSSTCSMTVETVPGIKNAFFGGEGFFNTVVKGPGKVYVQSMPAAKLASNIGRFIPIRK